MWAGGPRLGGALGSAESPGAIVTGGTCRLRPSRSECPSHRRGGGCEIERADFRHSGTTGTRSYDVDVPFMQLEQHGWDIHAVSHEPCGAAARDHRSQEHPTNARAPKIAAPGRPPARPD